MLKSSDSLGRLAALAAGDAELALGAVAGLDPLADAAPAGAPGLELPAGAWGGGCVAAPAQAASTPAASSRPPSVASFRTAIGQVPSPRLIRDLQSFS